MKGLSDVGMLFGRINQQRSELRRLKEKRALAAAGIKELEAESERLRGRIMAMRGLIKQSKETTFCNCSTCSRMRKEGWV